MRVHERLSLHISKVCGVGTRFREDKHEACSCPQGVMVCQNALGRSSPSVTEVTGPRAGEGSWKKARDEPTKGPQRRLDWRCAWKAGRTPLKAE